MPEVDKPQFMAIGEDREPGADDEVITPTIGIGIGTGGCKMLSTLYNVAVSEGIVEDFEFIGIDTNDEELRDNLPRRREKVTTIHLEKPDFWSQDKEDFGYLNDDLVNERSINNHGVTRTRPVARYHVDSIQNLDMVQTTLESRIGNFHSKYKDILDLEGGDRINIWVMNSLGGGTGSGSFILISALVDYITRTKIEGADAGQFSLMGIGTLPRLDYLEDGGSSRNAEFQVNAYAALSELLVFLDEDDDNNVRIPLEADIDGGIEQLDPEPPVFDRYFLFGGDKDKTGRDEEYTRQLNKTAVAVPHYFARLESPMNFPDGIAELRDERLWSFNGCEVRSPIGQIEKYFDVEERIEQLEEAIQEKDEEIQKYEDDIEYLEEVFDLKLPDLRTVDSLSDTSLPNTLEVSNKGLIKKCKNAALGFRMDQLGWEAIEEDIEAIASDTGDREILDQEEVVQYYYYQLFVKRLEDDMADHSAHDVIQEIWNEFRPEIEREYSYLEEDDAIGAWEGGIDRFLAERKEGLQDEMDRQLLSFFSPWWWKAWWQHRKVENLHSRGTRAYEKYSSLKETAGILEERYEETRDELQNKQEDFKTTRQDLEQDKSDLESEKENQETLREEVIDDLTTHQVKHNRLIDLPIRDPINDLTPDTTDEVDSIEEFEELGIIEEEDIARSFIDVLDQRIAEGPLQNRTSGENAERGKYKQLLSILIHEDNRGLLDTDLGEKNVQDLRGEFDRYQQEEQPTAEKHSIWLLGLYTQILLNNTSEYGTINQTYRDGHGDEAVASLFNIDDSSYYMTRRFAHPEFFLEDPDIGDKMDEYFKLRAKQK